MNPWPFESSKTEFGRRRYDQNSLNGQPPACRPPNRLDVADMVQDVADIGSCSLLFLYLLRARLGRSRYRRRYRSGTSQKFHSFSSSNFEMAYLRHQNSKSRSGRCSGKLRERRIQLWRLSMDCISLNSRKSFMNRLGFSSRSQTSIPCIFLNLTPILAFFMSLESQKEGESNPLDNVAVGGSFGGRISVGRTLVFLVELERLEVKSFLPLFSFDFT